MFTKTSSFRAFTLVEIMVVVGIFGFVAAGVIPFFVMNLKSQFVAEQKLLINGDIRKVTNQMVENAREANTFLMYQSFASQNRWDGTAETRDANGNGSVTSADRLLSSQSGDFVVLVFYKDPYFSPALYDGDPTNNISITTSTVNRMIGYWVAPNRRYPTENALYAFDTDTYNTTGAATWTTSWGSTFPAALSSTVTLESLLPPATTAYASAAEFSLLINNVNGLSNGYAFFNYLNRSIMSRLSQPYTSGTFGHLRMACLTISSMIRS